MKHLICTSLGHQLALSKQVTKHVVEYKCKRCNNEFTINGDGNLTQLNDKAKEINKTLEILYKKKLKRKQALLSH